MSPAQYRAARRARGTQQAVADAMGVHRVTIAKRESGLTVVTTEAWLALHTLPRLTRRQAHDRHPG